MDHSREMVDGITFPYLKKNLNQSPLPFVLVQCPSYICLIALCFFPDEHLLLKMIYYSSHALMASNGIMLGTFEKVYCYQCKIKCVIYSLKPLIVCFHNG